MLIPPAKLTDRRHRLSCLLVGVALFCVTPCARADQPTFLGPVETTNQRPYQLLFLSFPPQAASVLSRGQESTALKLDIGFDYLDPSPAYGAIVKEETETERFEYEESRGLGKGWQATLSIPVMWRNAGFLGAIVGPYHDLIHFNDPTIDAYQGRGHAALFHSTIFDEQAGGNVAVDDGPAFGLGDTSLYLKKNLWTSPGASTLLSARAGFKLPTGNPEELLGSGGFDEGIDLDLTQELTRRIAFHGSWNRVSLQRATDLDNTAPTVTGYNAALEIRAHRNASWIIQGEGIETEYFTGNTFADRPPRIAGVGYKWSPKSDTVWTAAFMEGGDYQTFHWPGVSDIGPDFTISIDMVRTH